MNDEPLLYQLPKKFPALGERFLVFLLPEELQDEIVGDLFELFHSDGTEYGASKARWNFWWEFLRMLPFLLRKFAQKKLQHRRRDTMSLFPVIVTRRRRRRLIIGMFLLAAILALNIILAQMILIMYVNTTHFHNESSALMLEFYLSASPSPVGAPEVSAHFADFISDSVAMHELNPVVPVLTQPFAQFNHFVYGYRCNGKTVIHSPTLAIERLSMPLVDIILTRGPGRKPTGGKTTVNEYLQSKIKTKVQLDSIRNAEREEHDSDLNRISKLCVYQEDSLWSLRLHMLKSGDTMYFRGVASDRQFIKANRPLIYDASIENAPMLKYNVRAKNNVRRTLTGGDEFSFALVEYENGKIVYQRGDTTDCRRVYPEEYHSYKKNDPVMAFFISNRYDVAQYRKFIRAALWVIFGDFGLLILFAYGLAHYRGYSIFSKRRIKEMEWEKERNDPK